MCYSHPENVGISGHTRYRTVSKWVNYDEQTPIDRLPESRFFARSPSRSRAARSAVVGCERGSTLSVLCALPAGRQPQGHRPGSGHPRGDCQVDYQGHGQRRPVRFGVGGRRLEIPRQNVLQIRAILLSMLNSGLLSNHQVAEVIGLTPAHTATLAHRLEQEDIASLIDKRQGQKSEYRVTPEVKAELIQQFVVDVVAHRKVSSETISAELKDRCQMTVPARTVRHHLARIVLLTSKNTLPQLLAAVKKSSET